MCKCLAKNVACCCFSCALNVLLLIITSTLLLAVAIGAIIYYVNKDNNAEDHLDDVKNKLTESFHKIKDSLSK